MFSQFRQAVENLAPHPRTSLDGQPADTRRDNNVSRSNSLDSPSPMSSSQLAESALSNLRKSLASQRSGSIGSLSKQVTSLSPREGRTKSRLEDRLRAATSVINEPSLSDTYERQSPSIISAVFSHFRGLSPVSDFTTLQSAVTVIPPDKEDTNSVDKSLEPMSKTNAEAIPTSSTDSPEETELSDEGSQTLQPPAINSPDFENSSDIERTRISSDSTATYQFVADETDVSEQSSALGSFPESLEAEIIAEKDAPLIQSPSTTDLANEPIPVGTEQVTDKLRPSDPDQDPISRTIDQAVGSKKEASIEELQEKLKQVEQRFTDVSISFKHLQEEKQTADLMLQEITPLESVHNSSALREYLRNLNSTTEIFQDEIKRLNGKLEVQEDRLEELRDTHRLESSSQSLQIEKLQREVSEAEALLKAAQSADTRAEETASEQKMEIDNLRKELERAKLLAKEEEEKRIKAISLLKTVRQKLVKAEKEKEDAIAAVTLLHEKEKEEKEKEQTEKTKLRSELDAAILERQKALTALRAQFDKEIANSKVRYDKDIATYKGQHDVELDMIKHTHTQEMSDKEAQMRSLQQSLALVTKDKNAFFDDLQLRQAELESAQSHLEALESQNTEYQYQLRELSDRYVLLKDDFAEVQRDLEARSREPATSSGELARLLSTTESKYESKLFDLRKNLEAAEKERNDSDAEWSRKLCDKTREAEDLKRLASIVAQTKEQQEETVAGLRINITTLEEKHRLLLEQLQELRQVNASIRESEKSWRSQDQELHLKITMLEQLVEESKQREGHLRAGNKTLREELRKVQSSVALLERQRNPGVGYWTSRSVENNPTASQVSVNSTGVTPRVSSPDSERKNGNDEEINLEYLRNVILQFLEHKEMREYLRHAIRDGSLYIATFVATLLQAARSSELHTPATLDMLCRVALDAHYSSGVPPIGSVVGYNESTVTILGIVQDALALLRIAHSLPLSHFHQLPASASELVILLLSCVHDISQVSTAQAMVYFADANDLLQDFQLAPEVRQVLETFVLSLSLLIGDDVKVAREAQMLHPIPLALGKGSIHGSGSETDIVTFSLFLHHLVSYRAHDFGVGDSQSSIALLVALFRWTAWSPVVFYTQLFLSAFTCLSQSSFKVLIWKAFVVGRLPRLLLMFEAAVNADGVTSTDWKRALQAALQTNFRQAELITHCDHAISLGRKASTSQDDELLRSFSRDLLQNFIQLDQISPTFAIGVDPFISNDDLPRLQAEAQDSGLDFEGYLDLKFNPDINVEELSSWIDRVVNDDTYHGVLSTAILRRFATLATTYDVDALGHLCKVLYTYEVMLDIMTLHIQVSDLISRALFFLDQYDCETVARFHLEGELYTSENRTLSSTFLKSTDTAHTNDSLSIEDSQAFSVWFKALFDSGSEGIEDSILRSTQPKVLLKISAALFLQAITFHMMQKIDKDTLTNGVSYFMGPLLSWTLVGIIKALIREIIQQRQFNVTTRIEILQTLLLSPSCPRPVLQLVAPRVYMLLGHRKGKINISALPGVDVTSIKRVIGEALGMHMEDMTGEPPGPISRVSWEDEPRQLIQTALTMARTGKAPSLDVAHCIKIIPPTTFLQLLWSELAIFSSVGEMEISRRIATFVLTMPQSSNIPPLLPIFLHVVMPSIIFAMDHQQTPDHTLEVDLLVTIISSALTAALHLELGIRSVTGEHQFVLGQPSSGMARKLAADLRARRDHTSRTVLQKLASSQSFAANFAVSINDLS
ncbi:hypothetical protein C0995_010083 [Termitomyces sp. Mi166|nr:hypothetical protein C0995_010083 [Termitomyces sp. Mi166\